VIPRIELGYQVFDVDGGEEFGAVRDIQPDHLLVYIENAGDFRIPAAAVKSVHYQKVIVDCSKLDRPVRDAIGHAHDREAPGL
jgi:hypothetical protein